MKKLLITSAVTVALTLGACSDNKTFEELISEAQKSSEQGEYAAAIIDYKNAIRLAPKNAETRLGLGKAYLKQGLYVNAEKELDKADELGASFSDSVLLQAQVKTRLGKFSAVEKLVKQSEDLDDEKYAVVLSYAGISTLFQGEITKAQDYFSQASTFNNTDYGSLSKAYLLYIDKDIPQALSSLEGMLVKTPDFAEAIRLKGHLNFSLKNYAAASRAFQQYIQQYPEDRNIRFVLVDSLIKAKKIDEARTLTAELLKYFKDSPLAYQFQSQIDFHDKKYIEARDNANLSLNLSENSIISKSVAGISSYKLNELEQAYDHLIGIEKLLPATHPINAILLSIKIKLGHTEELNVSIDRLKALTAKESDVDLLQLASQDLIAEGNYTQAQALINKAVTDNPKSATAKVQQGALLLSQGDLSGIKSIEEALTIDPSLHQTEFALARQYIKGNQIGKAQAIADKWLVSTEFKATGYVLSGMILSKQNKITEAEVSFNQALALEPNNISALYSLAAVHDFKGDIHAAISGYKKVINLNLNHYNAIRRYSALSAKENNLTEAISFLSTLYEQNKGTNTESPKKLVIGLAQTLTVNKQVEESITLLESIEGESNLSNLYWLVLAETYTINSQYNKALAAYQRGIQKYPTYYPLRVGNFRILNTLGKLPEALVSAQQSASYFPNDENIQSYIAYLELVNSNIEAAKAQLLRCKAKGFSNPLLLETEAKIALAEKDFTKASALFSGIYTNSSTSINAINLARSLQFNKQGDEAELVLEQYLQKNNTNNRVRLLLAELYETNNVDESKSIKVIETYQKAIATEPSNAIALNNLAWQQYKAGKLEQALEHIEKAISVEPENINLQETYGVILVATKQFNEAIAVFDIVFEKGSTDTASQVALIEAYVATNQITKAKKAILGLSDHDNELNSKIIRLKQSLEKS